MKLPRKSFLRLSGLAGLGMMVGNGNSNAGSNIVISHPYSQQFNMHGYTARDNKSRIENFLKGDYLIDR